jgi:acyl carrier protein
MDEAQIRQTVKSYVMAEFLPGEPDDSLLDTTPLMTGGLLDSIGTIRLIAFLEERFGIRFSDEEAVPERLDTLADIAGTVRAKLPAR